MTPEKKESQEHFEKIYMKQIEEELKDEDIDFQKFSESLLKLVAKNSGFTEEEIKLIYPRFR